MRLSARCLSIATCLAAFSVPAFAEQVDNPAYKAWAKYKPGTTVMYTQSTEMPNLPPGMASPQTKITEKLVEVKPDEVTLEVTTETQMMGHTRTMPARQQTVAAKVDKEKMGMPPTMKGEVKDMKEGKDKVEVNGKSVDATTREMTVIATEPRPMTAHVKMWYTEEVPGGMAKVVTNVESPMQATSTMTLTDFQIAK